MAQVINAPAPAPTQAVAPQTIATPVLDAMMMKLGAHCEHGGEALVFVGLDGDGRVSARQLSGAMDRLGHPKLDLEVLGKELQAGSDFPITHSA